jgi:hypothetical protein
MKIQQSSPALTRLQQYQPLIQASTSSYHPLNYSAVGPRFTGMTENLLKVVGILSAIAALVTTLCTLLTQLLKGDPDMILPPLEEPTEKPINDSRLKYRLRRERYHQNRGTTPTPKPPEKKKPDKG